MWAWFLSSGEDEEFGYLHSVCHCVAQDYCCTNRKGHQLPLIWGIWFMLGAFKSIWPWRWWLQALWCFTGLYLFQHILVLREGLCALIPGTWLCFHQCWCRSSPTLFLSVLLDRKLCYSHLSSWWTQIRIWVYYLWSVYQTQLQCAEKLALWGSGKPRNEWMNR